MIKNETRLKSKINKENVYTQLLLFFITATFLFSTNSFALSKTHTTYLNDQIFSEFSSEHNKSIGESSTSIKFLISSISDNKNSKLYFINSNIFNYHYDFYIKMVSSTHRERLELFNKETYFTDKRKHLAGNLTYYNHMSQHPFGIYAIEFWYSDPVSVLHINKLYNMILTSSPELKGRLYFHPLGETHLNKIKSDEKKYGNVRQFPIITNDEIYQDSNFSVLNSGKSIGRLIQYQNGMVVTAKDILLMDFVPNDLSHVAGIISSVPQTPLSHVNLKAKQNKTPNIYVKDVFQDENVKELINQYVKLSVDRNGYHLEKASKEEVDRFFEAIRPKEVSILSRDLKVKKIYPLKSIEFGDADAFGSKTTNMAVLRKTLPSAYVPGGFGIPFYYYHEFMVQNNFYEQAKTMMNNTQFKNDPDFREQKLREFQKLIEKGLVSAKMEAEFEQVKSSFAKSPSNIRLRSSTNNEDLENFNGAGLYDSKTHKDKNKPLSLTIKKVWASLWNFRAFEEREFYKIDHMTAAMGILVHRNFKDEKLNGVAITKNIYDPNLEGLYINTQFGEDLVTNPNEKSIPEELLVIKPYSDEKNHYEIITLRKSNQVDENTPLLPKEHQKTLTAIMLKVHDTFKKLYHKERVKGFAMDIEFKVDSNNQLIIKQARPFIN